MSYTPGDAGTLNDEKRPGPSVHTSKTPSVHHVDVAKAEAEFNDLARQLTQHTTGSAAPDAEKGQDPESFNLREYLTSSNDANQQAGIQHKVCSFVICSSPLRRLNVCVACGRYMGEFESRCFWWCGKQGECCCHLAYTRV